MHTRRIGAFLIGAWLIGSLMMAFLTTQTLLTVERILANPPAAITKEISDIGNETVRQLLRFEAQQINRHVTETWEVLQLGLGAALLVTSVLTSHRSRFVIIGAVLMTSMVAYMYFVLTPTMNTLGRTFDFLPPTAAARERENFQSSVVWYNVLSVLKTIIGIAIAARLFFDRYEWRRKFFGRSGGRSHRGKIRRYHRPTMPRPSSAPASAAVEKVDAVKNPDDAHVDR